MAKPRIPDRSEEPAVQESLDHENSNTAANSSDLEPGDPHQARDDEGNAIEPVAKGKDAQIRPKPDSDAGSQ